jgi:hypothetical protein
VVLVNWSPWIRQPFYTKTDITVYLRTYQVEIGDCSYSHTLFKYTKYTIKGAINFEQFQDKKSNYCYIIFLDKCYLYNQFVQSFGKLSLIFALYFYSLTLLFLVLNEEGTKNCQNILYK